MHPKILERRHQVVVQRAADRFVRGLLVERGKLYDQLHIVDEDIGDTKLLIEEAERGGDDDLGSLRYELGQLRRKRLKLAKKIDQSMRAECIACLASGQGDPVALRRTLERVAGR